MVSFKNCSQPLLGWQSGAACGRCKRRSRIPLHSGISGELIYAFLVEPSVTDLNVIHIRSDVESVRCWFTRLPVFAILQDAHDSFSDWFAHCHHAKPAKPDATYSSTFTERVAHEHQMRQYEVELERWQHSLDIQTKVGI